jgi:hypothetical protein
MQQRNSPRQNIASNASWPQSGAISHFPHREQVRIIMECALLRYPQVELSTETIAAYKADWTDLLRDVGTGRFLDAVKQACFASRWFPNVADIVRSSPPPRTSDTYAGPTAEDLKRRAAGERSYGDPDVKCLFAIHANLRAKVNRPLTENDENGMINELDRRIDLLAKEKRV